MLPSVPEHAGVYLEVAQDQIRISSQRCKVPNVIIFNGAGLAQFNHRLVVLIHESRVRVVHEMDKLWKCREQFLFLFDNFVVELYPVGVKDGVADFVPYTLLLRVCYKWVLYLVSVG